jgi:GMP synthase-like glutamine amidotransferase
VPVLGVCFGAQSLAVALGGSVVRAARWERGWMAVATDDPDLVPSGPWFQWHEDAILPPPGATVVARTDLCVQAFTIGPHLAVQFHPEVTDIQVASWATDAEDPQRDELVARTRAELPAARARAAALLDRFLARVPVGTKR